MVDVSIIIPVYNAEKFLEKCVRSALSQTLRNIEIICVDDGSTDNSLNLLEKLQQEDNRILIFSQKNQGAGNARNYALMQAKGEFILFLDADDYLLNRNALDVIASVARKKHLDICGGFRCIDNEDKITPFYLHREKVQSCRDGVVIQYIDYQGDYYYQNYLYSRRMLMDNQLFFPNYRRFQDPPFFVKAMFYAKEFCVLPIDLYCYRVGHQNYNFNSNKIKDLLLGLIDNLEFSLNNNLKKLHLLTYCRINYACNDFFIKNVANGDLETLHLLLKANSIIQWSWINEYFETDKMISSLAFLINAGKEKISKESREERKWLFPFDKVKKNSKIILYGAGQVGMSYWKQIKEENYCEIVMWIDKNYQNIGDELCNIQDIYMVHKIDFDFLVIAISNLEYVVDVLDWLRKENIDPQKVVWSLQKA